MDNKEAYNQWSTTYDAMANKTRDTEALALRDLLSKVKFSNVLEIGCGTGKNTEWLAEKADHVMAVDFSRQMINEAKKKIAKSNVEFAFADVTEPWQFPIAKVDLITSSLILEHIQDIAFIFQQANEHLVNGGLFYVGELHPFKQYQGSKARFEAGSELVTLQCFTHHISQYMDAASKNKFSCLSLKEWFGDDENSIPRIIAFLFQKT